MRRLLALLLLALAPAGAAAADTSTSTNWAGYAVSGEDSSFSRVSGAWTVPEVTCHAGRDEWSAVWIGLGGYRDDASALEQIGTEADCDSRGNASYSAWYELVPDVSRDAPLTVRPGDRIGASVTVHGRRVRLRLSNRTTGRAVVRTLVARAIDVASAEWIVEAPSVCGNEADSSCRVMPLADFGTTRIAEARATTADGRTGAISSAWWDPVRIHLTGDAGLGAISGNLSASGRAFSVSTR